MKNNIRTTIRTPLVAIICAALATPLLAQVTPAAPDKDRPASTDVNRPPPASDVKRTDVNQTATHGMKPTKLDKVSGLLGIEVQDAQGEKLGDIADIVIDFEQGKVSYLVMSAGGVLGIGEKKLAVPITAFSVSTDTDGDDAHLVLRADKDSISRAEGIGENWPSAQNPSFGAVPFWQEREDRNVSPSTEPIRELDRPLDEPKRNE